MQFKAAAVVSTATMSPVEMPSAAVATAAAAAASSSAAPKAPSTGKDTAAPQNSTPLPLKTLAATSFATAHPDIDNHHHKSRHHHHDHHNSQAAEHHQLRTAVAGAVAAAVARVFVQPLDVLKIRFQLQVEPLHHTNTVSSKYTSMWQAMQTIAREEGVRAFWKGHNPAQGLSVAYGVAQFWTYERLKAEAKHLNVYAAHRDSTNFVCGAVAGAMANAVITPLDVIRTRLIAQDNRKGYTNTLHAAKTIMRSEGVRGLYRGIGPAMLQVAPLTGINFMAYNKLCVWSVIWLRLESKW